MENMREEDLGGRINKKGFFFYSVGVFWGVCVKHRKEWENLFRHVSSLFRRR